MTASQNPHDFKEQVTDNKRAVWADSELWCFYYIEYLLWFLVIHSLYCYLQYYLKSV